LTGEELNKAPVAFIESAIRIDRRDEHARRVWTAAR
jgi:hypothetical protein